VTLYSLPSCSNAVTSEDALRRGNSSCSTPVTRASQIGRRQGVGEPVQMCGRPIEPDSAGRQAGGANRDARDNLTRPCTGTGSSGRTMTFRPIADQATPPATGQAVAESARPNTATAMTRFACPAPGDENRAQRQQDRRP
jgi:hypothetical protein